MEVNSWEVEFIYMRHICINLCIEIVLTTILLIFCVQVAVVFVGILFVASSCLFELMINECQLENLCTHMIFWQYRFVFEFKLNKLCIKFWLRLHFCMFLLETVPARMLFLWLSWMYHNSKQWEAINWNWWIVLKANAIRCRCCSVCVRWWLFIHRIGPKVSGN